MDITQRQLGRLEAAVFGLESAAHESRFSAAETRLVGVLRELVEDIVLENGDELDARNDGFPPMPVFDFETRKTDGLPMSVRHSEPADGIRMEAAEMLGNGRTAKDIITDLMRRHSMTTDAMARMLRVNQGSLSHFLTRGERHNSVRQALQRFALESKEI